MLNVYTNLFRLKKLKILVMLPSVLMCVKTKLSRGF